MLTECSEWILLSASAKRGAIESTLIFSILFASLSGIVSVRTISSMTDPLSLSIAGPERTPWVAQA